MRSEGGFVESTAIAQKTKLGNSKSSVNRYLYFLEKQQVLVREGKTFALKKSVTGISSSIFSALGTCICVCVCGGGGGFPALSVYLSFNSTLLFSSFPVKNYAPSALECLLNVVPYSLIV